MIRALLILAQIYPGNIPAGHYFDAAWGGAAEPAFDDPVARLDRKLAAGSARLEFRESYLANLLEQLNVSPDSQMLVFSKTSFQAARIGPRNPRAIYFNDSVAVSFIPGAEVMELAAVDPKNGVAFYTLETRRSESPRFAHREVCLSCHYGPATLGVPGIFVGSVYPDATGMPNRSAAIITDHRTPFEDRWGGWFVDRTGAGRPDRSNAVATDPADPNALEPLPRLSRAAYLTPHSDIVALMTFEHQTHMTNLLTRLHWLVRIGEPAPIEAAIRETAAYLTFADEAPLPGPIVGASTFAKTFPRRGPLREFDLKTRLFRGPLSYMIYSEQFDALPPDIRKRIYRSLPAAALEILKGTKPDV